MAITERGDKDEKATRVDIPRRKGPYVLTAEESESLLHILSEPLAPLSPEIKRAIANYKRIKAERLR